jgi:hypothetical protein
MPDRSTQFNQSAAIVDPQTNTQLGQISLIGEPFSATEWMSSSGSLQSFVIVDGMNNLRRVWTDQEEVLLRTEFVQRYIKIVTYPAEGEKQGYLDCTGDFERIQDESTKSIPRISVRRGLAFLQSILGT